MLEPSYPYYLANKAVYANTDLEVTDKYTGEVARRWPWPGRHHRRGIAAAGAARHARAAAYERQAVLEHCAARFKERADELAQALCIEAGKPIKDAAAK